MADPPITRCGLSFGVQKTFLASTDFLTVRKDMPDSLDQNATPLQCLLGCMTKVRCRPSAEARVEDPVGVLVACTFGD